MSINVQCRNIADLGFPGSDVLGQCLRLKQGGSPQQDHNCQPTCLQLFVVGTKRNTDW